MALTRTLITILIATFCHHAAAAPATLDYAGIYFIGDSLSAGYNADGACNNDPQLQNTWSVGDASSLAYSGNTAVYSYSERVLNGVAANTIKHVTSYADFGYTLLRDIKNKATQVKDDIINNSRSSYRNKVIIMLGHTDYCAGVSTKSNDICYNENDVQDDDLDTSLYCTPKASAVAREINAALDILITVPKLTIVLSAPFRMGQACNFQSKFTNYFLTCKGLWNYAYTNYDLPVCLPLTAGGGSETCTSTRLADSYDILNAYKTKLENAATTYNASGSKATGVRVLYSDTLWNTKIKDFSWMSPCDCAHMSKTGNDLVGKYAYNGITCSSTTPCCKPPGATVTKAQAGACTATKTSGSFAAF